MHEQASYLDNGDSYWDTSDTNEGSIDDDTVSYSVYETARKAQNKRPYFPPHIWNKMPVDVRADILKHDWSSSSSDRDKPKSKGNPRFAAKLHQVDETEVLDTDEDVQKLIVNVVQETFSSMMKLASNSASSSSSVTVKP